MDNFNCSDDDLVLGMYPLRLVTEAVRKIGAQFCVTTDVGPHWQRIPIILEQEPKKNASVSQIRPSGHQLAATTCI